MDEERANMLTEKLAEEIIGIPGVYLVSLLYDDNQEPYIHITLTQQAKDRVPQGTYEDLPVKLEFVEEQDKWPIQLAAQ